MLGECDDDCAIGNDDNDNDGDDDDDDNAGDDHLQEEYWRNVLTL